MSPYLQTKVSYVGQKEVFSEGAESLLELAGIEVTAKQIERVCHHWGEQIEPILEQASLNTLERPKGLHYVMVDGAMLLTRYDKWKEVKLGRIFRADDMYKLGTEEDSRGWIKSSNYTAHLGTCHDFYDKFSNKVDLLEEFICIGDGAKWIWNWCKNNYPKAIRILDYWHATERLWKFIKLLYTCKKKQAAWIAKQESLLWEDKVEDILSNVAAISTKKKAAIEDQKNLLTYLTNNKDKMLYGTYRANGWLVGSGPIESAHRTVIQKRLKLSGQRWTLWGAQQVLNLRVAHKNDNWNTVIQLIAQAC